MRPAPMLRCPTSLLPKMPGCKPTSWPEAESCVCGQLFHRESKLGVLPIATALAIGLSERPQPSRIHSITGRGTVEGGTEDVIAPVSLGVCRYRVNNGGRQSRKMQLERCRYEKVNSCSRYFMSVHAGFCWFVSGVVA